MSYDKHYSKWKDFLSVSETEKATAQEGASISKRQQTESKRKQRHSTEAVVNKIVKELAEQPLSEQVRDLNTSQLHEVNASEMEAIQPMLDRLAKEGTSILPFAHCPWFHCCCGNLTRRLFTAKGLQCIQSPVF